MQQALYCEELTRYAEDQLNTVKDCHPNIELFIERTPLALTIRFRKPIKPIINKYSLSCESLKVHGDVRHYVHIYIMPSTSKEIIDKLVDELKQDGTFENDGVSMLLDERSSQMDVLIK